MKSLNVYNEHKSSLYLSESSYRNKQMATYSFTFQLPVVLYHTLEQFSSMKMSLVQPK